MAPSPDLKDHPAKFSEAVLATMAQFVYPTWRVLDPFAGTGGIHRLLAETWGVEIEPEWANHHERTLVGDALHLPFADCTFQCVATSPSYGNRMSDLYSTGRAKASTRYTYRLKLDRDLHEHNGARFQWGPEYRSFHREFLIEARRVLMERGVLLLNVSDHIRQRRLEAVSEWWVGAATLVGFRLEQAVVVDTHRMRNGENHELRPTNEWVFVMTRES